MPPRLIAADPYAQYKQFSNYVDPASFTSRSQQDAALAVHAESLAKSQAVVAGTETPLNKSMVLRKLEQGVKGGLIDPSYIARLDVIGPEATIAQLPAATRAALAF
jgi:hypothetical protein